MDVIVGQKQVKDGEPVSLRRPGAVLLISCYELGHQPVGVAQPMGFLEQADYAPAALDISVEEFDAERTQAGLVHRHFRPHAYGLTLGCPRGRIDP